MHKVLLAGVSQGISTDLEERCPSLEFRLVKEPDETLEVFDEDSYSLLVLDSRMGLTHSIEVLRRLRERPWLARLKKLFCLSREQGQGPLVRRIMELGVSGVCYRPLQGEELARQIARVLGVRLGVSLLPTGSRAQFADLTRRRVEHMRRAARTGVAAPLRLELKKEAGELVRNLRTFGFERGSEVAEKLHAQLAQTRLTDLTLAEVEVLCDRLLGELNRPKRQAQKGPRYEVVFLEPDQALGEVFLTTAKERGFRACWFTRGEAMLESSLSTRVVVLDGPDQSPILSQLARRGLLKRLRAIALGRCSEEEVVELLERGAYDFLRKPFNLPVLMLRINRALSA